MDFPKKTESYHEYYIKNLNKQTVVTGCIEELTGNEPIDQSLESKLKECVYKQFDVPSQTIKRFTEMFPDLVVTESKL